MKISDWINSPLRIADFEIENRLILAPMAGSSDLPFRQICRRSGAAWTISELVSARGVVQDPGFRRNMRYLELSPEEKPISLQLFGAEANDFARAIELILQDPLLRNTASIDLNLGCPVPKVVRTGQGSALMRDPERLRKIIKAAVQAAERENKSITCKMRSGWDAESINAPQIAALCEAEGVSAIAVHARTRDQFYSGRADWQVLATVRKAVNIPLVGNGDIASLCDIQSMYDLGMDAVMIGRAAQGNPWLFRQLLDPEYQGPSAEEWLLTVREHLAGQMQRLGEEVAIREFRTTLSYYLKGMEGAASLRRELMQTADLSALQSLLERASMHIEQK